MSEGGVVRHGFPGYRVFIFGMEVTEDCVSVVTTSHPDTTPNTANITLLSPHNRYYVVDDDIIDIARIAKLKSKAPKPADTIPGSTWYMPPTEDGVTSGDSQPVFSEQDRIKTQILKVKTSVPPIDIPPSEYPGIVGTYVNPQAAERYPFQSGKPIFHPMDPVRIFRRDEFNPSRWYHWFTGVVSDFGERYTHNQEHDLTITAEAPNKMLRYARFTSNPGLIDINQMAVRNAIVPDIVSREVFANLFNGRSLPEIMCALLFGDRAFRIAYDQALHDWQFKKRSPRPMASIRGPLLGRSVPSSVRPQLRSGRIRVEDANRLAEEAGFIGEDINTIVAIAQAESSLEPNVALDLFGKDSNGNWKTKKRDASQPKPAGVINTMYGLFQINERAWIDTGKITKEEALDPATAFRAAYKVATTQGWTAWEVYTKIDQTTGKPMYAKHLPQTWQLASLSSMVAPQESFRMDQYTRSIDTRREIEIPIDYKDEAQDWVSETIYGAWGSAQLGRRMWGVGHANFKASKVWLYDNNLNVVTGIPAGMNVVTANGMINSQGELITDNDSSANNLLETYQSSLDCMVTASDFNYLKAEWFLGGKRLDSDFIINNNITVEDIISEIGMHPEMYPVDGGRLMMLLPPGVTGSNREIVTHDLITSFQLNTEWTSRAQIIHDILERIEFVFYMTPRGDYCVEFPLYDFEPADFGLYGDEYLVHMADTVLVDAGFSDSKVVTQLTMAAQFVPNWKFSEDLSNIINRTTATLWHLIPTFGVRHAPITPKGYVATLEAASLYSHMSLNRANADTYTQNVHVLPNINFWLNRPVLIDVKSHIGTIKSITHQIQWGLNGSVDTRIGINSMRGWDGTLDMSGKRVYTPIGGNASRPLNYKMIFNQNRETVSTTITPTTTVSADQPAPIVTQRYGPGPTKA